MKKSISVLCVLLSVCMMLTSTASFSASADNDYYQITVAEHTKEEIANYMAEHEFDVYADDEYDEEPSDSAPYAYGKLSDETLMNALNIVNVIRYTAGLQEVQLDNSLSRVSQAACVVNSANGVLSHFPTKPDDMDDDFYKDGYTGASQSNLCMGYGSLANGVLNAWTSDGDSKNRTVVGHRRWILYPQMGVTSFGACKNFNSMYVWDDSNYKNANETGVVWPAKYTPIELFDKRSPWSISFAAPYQMRDGEDNVPMNISNTTVKIESLTQNRVWNISENSDDGELYIDRVGYGQPCCLIFAPVDIDISVGQSYRVTVSSHLGDLSYTVEFFDPENITPEPEPEKSLLGDVNDDNNVTTADALVVLRYSVGFDDFDEDQLKIADVNNNGRVNTADALLIQRYSIGIDTGYDIGKPVS